MISLLKTLTGKFGSRLYLATGLSLSLMGYVTAQTKYEAENAQLTGVSTATAVSGYSGTGYISPSSFDANGDQVTFTVNASSAGSYPLVIRYGGFNGEKYQTISVNGKVISNCATKFPSSSSFTDLNYGNITLNSGSNTITISKCYGWMAIDYITVGTSQTTTDSQAPSAPTNVATSGVSQNSLTLSWSASSDNVGVTGYDIYRNGTFLASSTSTSYNASGLSCKTAYTFYVKAKDAAGNQSANSSTVNVTTSGCTSGGTSGMTAGTQFWNIGWESPYNFFAQNVNWSTTTNPWNSTFISELQAAKIKTLRFMDWNNTNSSSVKNWSQRIPKTANHYNVDNKVVLYRDDYNSTTNTHTLVADAKTGYGVAYEWQIDLCNRIGADLWINTPIQASPDYLNQLATLIKNNLNSNLKVYVEYANETWNTGFCTWVYAYQQGKALGLDKLNYNGAYVEPWWAYQVYAAVRVFEQFENVFGTNNARIVKVLGGQVGYHWPGYDYNHQTIGHLTCLNNSTINPKGITVNAYAMAPYMGGKSINDQSTAINTEIQNMIWAKNSLKNTSIKLICYEGGSDNYPDNNLTLTRDAQQQSLYVKYLSGLAPYVDGPFNQYTFYGGPWGLKNVVGESASVASKWRGWIDYWVEGKRAKIGSDGPDSFESANESYSVFPNPATHSVTVNSAKEIHTIRIIGSMGNVVKSVSAHLGMNTIDINGVPTGIYSVVITDVNGKNESLKLAIQ